MKKIVTAVALAATLSAGAFFGFESQPQAEQSKLAFSPSDLTRFDLIQANNGRTVKVRTNGQYSENLFADGFGSGASFAAWSISVNGDNTISFQNGRYPSSSGGPAFISSERYWWQNMTCNRPAVGAWEKFIPSQQAGGTYAFKSVQTGRLVSSENGNNPMRARTLENQVGAWERFTLIDNQ